MMTNRHILCPAGANHFQLYKISGAKASVAAAWLTIYKL
jgi:hypothetical protein